MNMTDVRRIFPDAVLLAEAPEPTTVVLAPLSYSVELAEHARDICLEALHTNVVVVGTSAYAPVTKESMFYIRVKA